MTLLRDFQAKREALLDAHDNVLFGDKIGDEYLFNLDFIF